MKELTQKELKAMLHYEPSTGVFTWKERLSCVFGGKNTQRSCNTWNSRFAGKKAGVEWKSGNNKSFFINIRITIKGEQKKYLAHRLAFLYMTGEFPTNKVDHIDQNGLNNEWSNLRDLTESDIQRKKPIQLRNTSGCIGVTWYKQTQRWKTQIRVNGKNIYGGYFIELREAIAKRKQLEIDNNYYKNH